MLKTLCGLAAGFVAGFLTAAWIAAAPDLDDLDQATEMRWVRGQIAETRRREAEALVDRRDDALWASRHGIHL